MSNKSAQRQVVARITPVKKPGDGTKTGPAFPGYFAQVSGGEVTAAVEKVYDGGERFPENLCAPAEIGDLTVTRHYAPARDRSSLKKLRPLVGSVIYDVVVEDLNCDLAVRGTQRVYPEALLVGISEPEGDAASGAPTMFSLTFSIAHVARDTD